MIYLNESIMGDCGDVTGESVSKYAGANTAFGRVETPFDGHLWRDILAGRENMAPSSTYERFGVVTFTPYDICLAT